MGSYREQDAVRVILLEQDVDGNWKPVLDPSTGGTGTGSTDAADINIVDTANYYTSGNVEGALQEVGVDIGAANSAASGAAANAATALATANNAQTDIDDHLADTIDAHDASAISVADAGGNFTSTDAEGALAEAMDAAQAAQADADTAQTTADNHIADTSDAHDASAISVADANATITATDVEGALEEISANNYTTNAKLADMATQTIKGRTTAGTGDPQDLTAAQAAAIVNASIDHGTEAGLGDDDHSQYANITAQRSGDQTWQASSSSGAKLIVRSTSHATKGKIIFSPGADFGSTGESLQTNAIFGAVVGQGSTIPVSTLLATNIFTTSGSQDVWANIASTSDATPTNIVSFTPTASTGYQVIAYITALKTDQSALGIYTRRAAFRVSSGGAVTQVSTTQTIGTDIEDTAGWDATIDTSGGAIRVRVTGAAATAVEWSAFVYVFTVG